VEKQMPGGLAMTTVYKMPIRGEVRISVHRTSH
jgi:hypothetical protein